ncbi:MAG TPA: GAF domain-containing protein [Quisquiliibacterium sp.]|nr:GAF domain-containing protein [Quisquiliibacterium sp.]
MTVSLAGIRDALEGGAPAVIATCAADGTPNVSYLSDVQYVDERHVALSWQFFSKTRANVIENPFARLLVIHASSAGRTRLLVQYLRTETEGPLFERMRARLAGIASHQGMADVFRLRGADVYRVLGLEAVPGPVVPQPPSPGVAAPLRAVVGRLARARELDELIDDALDALVREFGIPNAMLLMRDAAARRLCTVASRGYPVSGVGAEVAEGDGVIGVAAAVGVPIRVNHALAGHAYARVVREQAAQAGLDDRAAEAIPLPGLPAPGSQMAVPVGDGGRVIGVLYVEHPEAQRFGHELEDALATLADAFGLAMRRWDEAALAEQPAAERTPPPPPPPPQGAGVQVRLHARHCAVFIDDEYVIRGVAGAILWKLLREHAERGRSEFTSRELRADGSLNLPEIGDNLAARLILLQRRLDERDFGVRLRKRGRGRFGLEVSRPLIFREARG